NRHDRRVHDPRDAIAWALNAPVAFVVPHDLAGANRALGAHWPLVYEERSPAARALVRLAELVHGGTLGLAPDPKAPERPTWGRLLARAGRPWRPRPRPVPAEGGPLGGRDAVVHA